MNGVWSSAYINADAYFPPTTNTAAAYRRIYSMPDDAPDDTSAKRLSAECYNFGWNGRYNLNYRGPISNDSGGVSIRAQPNLFGAFSIYTSDPFLGNDGTNTGGSCMRSMVLRCLRRVSRTKGAHS
eukprot:3953030-Pyramimonas_sp.AAC.1